MATRATELCRRVSAITSAHLFTPSGDHITSCRADAHRLEKDIKTTKERIATAEEEYGNLGPAAEKRLVEILVSAEAAVAVAGSLPDRQPSEKATSESLASSQATVILGTTASKTESNRTSPVSEVEDETEEEEMIDEPERAGSLSASRHSAISEPPSATAGLSPRDANNWQALTQLRHWLTEAERDAGLTVDLSDHIAIRNMSQTVQGIGDQVRLKLMDVVGIQDSSAAEQVKQKARELGADMGRVANQCEKRRGQLAVMSEAVRAVEQARGNMELWLEKVEMTLGEKRGEETTDEVRKELEEINEIIGELDGRKQAMAELNNKVRL